MGSTKEEEMDLEELEAAGRACRCPALLSIGEKSIKEK